MANTTNEIWVCYPPNRIYSHRDVFFSLLFSSFFLSFYLGLTQAAEFGSLLTAYILFHALMYVLSSGGSVMFVCVGVVCVWIFIVSHRQPTGWMMRIGDILRRLLNNMPLLCYTLGLPQFFRLFSYVPISLSLSTLHTSFYVFSYYVIK